MPHEDLHRPPPPTPEHGTGTDPGPDGQSALGISTSYVNLLEKNERSVSVPVLLKLFEVYGVDWRDIAEDDDTATLADLRAALQDPLFEGTAPTCRSCARPDPQPRPGRRDAEAAPRLSRRHGPADDHGRRRR
jgi:transcriptional regulator with XRE-family HTH domain